MDCRDGKGREAVSGVKGELVVKIFGEDPATLQTLADGVAATLRDVPGAVDWYLPLFGAVVVIMMVWLPDGLMSLPDRLKAKRDSKLASEKRAQDGAKLGAGA